MTRRPTNRTARAQGSVLTTAESARAIAQACRKFRHLLGPASAEMLLDWVGAELGHKAALDNFQIIGGQLLRAVAPGTILHIVAGNTPHAALQSLVRGLLLGSHNLCKLPATGLPEAEAFAAALPAPLRKRIEFSRTLPRDWPGRADAIIVFGSDETVAHFRALAGPRQIFLGYGHRISLGLVFKDAAFKSAPLAARNVSLFDQQGCLSPHCIYVADRPEEYAAHLAVEMESIARTMPRAKLTLSEAAAIAEVRDTARFRAALGQRIRIWENAASWLVIFDADPAFSPSVLNRVIFVRPMPDNLAAAIAPARPFLSTIAIWPDTAAGAAHAAALGASRICPIGKMQFPPWTWRHDGRPTLAPLVTWIGWEKAN